MNLINSIRISCGGFMTKGPLVPQQIVVRDSSKFRTIENRLGLPSKPKRPLAGFMRFSVENRPKVKENHPTLRSFELSKIIGKMWNALSDDQKEEYSKDFNEKKFDYIAQMREYHQALTEDDKKRLKSITTLKKTRKGVLASLRQQQELGRPKRPTNPFVKFFIERSRERDRGKKVAFEEWANFYRQVASEWRALSDDEKAKYRSPDELENYKNAMFDWRAKMISEGRGDLIPNKHEK